MADTDKQSTVSGWLTGHRVELRLSIRVVVAAILAFGLAHLLGLAQGYWAVITAVLVMQASVGGSVRATIDRMIGTVAGAVYGGIVDILIPHATTLTLGVALAVAVAPLAVAASLSPAFRVAPVTAIIVLLTPGAGELGPLTFTINRILEIGLGCLVGLAVALSVVPARAHGLAAEAAGSVLDLLSDLLPAAVAGMERPIDRDRILGLQRQLRAALARLETAVTEARGERAAYLTDQPDPDPLLRNVTRLRNDLVIVVRAASEPLPEIVGLPLAPAFARLSDAGSRYLADSAIALRARKGPPALGPFAESIGALRAEVESVRRQGLTRGLHGDAVGRLFTLGFAFEQMYRDLQDTEARIRDFATDSPVKA
jgi:uncharacterized membrane protein YccC